MSGNDNNVFALDKNSGALIIGKPLDYDATPNTYTLVVRASDRSAVPKFDTSTIQLSVLDANDNYPSCTASLYTGSVMENAAFMTGITAVDCTDLDTVGTIKYSILDGNVGYVFIVNENTGEVSVAKDETLDIETIDVYDLIIQVTDGKFAINVTVIITVLDVNDIPPHFIPAGPYQTDLSEDAPVGHTLISLNVSDNDVSVTTFDFTIAAGNSDKKFQIGKSSGIIQLQRKIDRDVLQDPVYSLDVTVSDGVFTSTTTVIINVIDVNDNYPVCDQTTYTSVTPETAIAGSTVFSPVCSDPDSTTDLLFQIVSGNDEDKFLIDEDDGKLKIKSELDYEKTTSYTITVSVSDQGNPALTTFLVMSIFVGAVNEHKPKLYGDFNVSIAEDAPINQAVVTLFANDSDVGLNHAYITYAIKSGNTRDLFSLHPSSGVMSLRGRLDFETSKTHILTVTATDMSPADSDRKSSEETLTIHVLDVNDNYPIFSPQIYSVEINENTPLDTTVVELLATDADAGIAGTDGLQFSITRGNIGSVFAISGNVIVLTSDIDAETRANYILTVSASDQGKPVLSSNTVVSIHVRATNDYPPTFSVINDTVHIKENANIGMSIYQSTATDQDTGIYKELRYYIRDGNLDGAFSVDMYSGDITVAKSLDYETYSPPYILRLEVEDTHQTQLGITKTGTMTLTVLLIDTNDDTPLFSKNKYNTTIKENIEAGTSIMTVTAFDKDSGPNGVISYHIVSGNGMSHFEINSTSGVIRTKEGSIIDYEEIVSYDLIVKAEDNGNPKRSSSCLVKITVKDLNDETPEFEVGNFVTSFTEQEPVDTYVTTVVAFDADSIANNNNVFTYMFSESSAHFRIVDKTGDIFTTAILDREVEQRYGTLIK